MRGVIALGLVALFLASGSAVAATRIVPVESVGPEDVPRVQLLSADRTGVDLVLELPALSMETLTVEGQDFQSVAIPGGGLDGEIGQPGIPTFTRLVQIPAESGVTVTATPMDEEDIPGVTLMPVQSEDGEALSLDAAAYAREGFDAMPGASAGSPAIARDLRVVPVTFRPVHYDAARKVLRVSRQVRVRIDFAGQDLTNALTRTPDFIPESFDRLYRAMVVNYAPEANGDKSGTQVGLGTWLVICANDAAVTSRLQTLMDWRQREGYTVKLATTSETGTSTSSIKAYLQNAYNTWTPPLEYVVFAGDAGGSYGLPTFTENLSGYGGEGDHPYSQLAGGDVLSDVHLGRLSFGSLTELDVIVAKSVNYEATPYTATDRGWFARACLVGDPSHSGYSTVQVQQWIKTRLRQIGYTQIDTVFSGNFVSDMATALNRGDSIFCYRGYYGFSGWSNSYTNALTNINKLHFAVISTCGTGSWAGGTSNSEQFLRAGTVTSPKAGIGSVGTATTGTHTRFNNCYTFGTFQGLLYEDQWEMGAAHTRGKYELYVNYQSNDPNAVLYFSYWNTLMGDPAVRVWTAYPAELDVIYPATLAVGTNSVVVTVTEGAALPCEGARVCLLKGTETFCSALTDAAGQVELPVNAATTGTMKLTVTKHNRQPVLADIAVTAPTLFVGYQASTVDDDNSGGSQGNSNAIVNPGETIQLKVQVKNFGSQSASNVTATLTTDDPYVTITDADEPFGTIAGGASAWSTGDFDFTVSNAAGDGHVIRFGLDVVSGANQWHSLIDVPVVSADFAAVTTTLYNAGNGILDPGETLEMSVSLRNQGGANAASVAGILTSQSPWVSVVDGSGTFGTINVGNTGENTGDRFTVHADAGAYQGYLAIFRLVTTCNGGAIDTTEIALTVGTRSSDDPIGPDQYGYFAFDNTDTSYPEAPVYSWVEIDPNYGGTGTLVALGDYGDYQDQSTGTDLPFTFMFYGEPFTRATICSNGWIAMGNTYLTDYRNWYLPGAGCPQNLIAAFWDDLQEVVSPAGHVYQKYDAANHRWIVEWSHLHNVTGGTATFQAILLDPLYHAGPSGDGIIIFQYSSVANTDGTDGYATVGIQNFDHTDGLTYTYFNNYPAGAATLATGRAIKFLPTTTQPSGEIQGTVRNASQNLDPLADAVVALIGTTRIYASDLDGSYGGSAGPGTYTAVCSRAGFAPDSVQGVTITAGQITTVDFLLEDVVGPEITQVTDLVSATDTVGPYPVGATVADPSGVSTVSLFYRVSPGEWVEVPMTLDAGTWVAAIPGMPEGSAADYYVEAFDLVGHRSADPADAPDSFYTFRVTTILYSTDCEDPGDPAWQLGVAGDNATAGIWIRDDPVGTWYGTQPIQPEDDHTLATGVKCFVTENGVVGGPPGDADVDGGCTTLRSPVFDLSGAEWAAVRYWRWFGEGSSATDDQFAVDVSSNGGGSWVPLERIPETMTDWGVAAFDLTTKIALTSQVVFRFVACDVGAAGLVEAAVDDFSLEVYAPDVTDAPESLAGTPFFRLEPGRPNPFADNAVLAFSTEREGPARLVVFDAAGRMVRRLVNGPIAAGPHTMVWDGRDDRGVTVPSGIYFYRLDAGGQHRMEKLLRLK